MPGGERIVSTSTGDVLGSRWGRPAPASVPRRPTPPQQPQPAAINGGDDIIGSRRAASPQKRQPSEPIISTIDEGDIIGRHRWVPRIDRVESSNSSSSLLLTSRHATPAPSATTTSTQSASNGTPHTASSPSSSDLNKLKRLINRLSWKSHTLLYTQHVALTSSTPTTTTSSSSSSAAATPTAMFKLDFFEYYTLLERVLVLVLAHFRVPVPKSTIGGGGGGTNNSSTSNCKSQWNHRYHESVLEAVEQPGTPVGEVLGVGEVARALRRAKGFRNRWKDADEQVVAAWECQREDILELRLEELVEVVLGALERVYGVAEERAAAAAAAANAESGVPATQQQQQDAQRSWGDVGYGYVDEDMEDAPWEAVGDAMEDLMDMDVE